MKTKRIFLGLFAVFVLSGVLEAQERDREVFRSIGIFYNVSVKKDRGKNLEYAAQSIWLGAGFFFFPEGRTGYYINPAIGFKIKTRPGKDTRLEDMVMYCGVSGGLGVKILEEDKVDLLAGAGPDLSFMVRLEGAAETEKVEKLKTFLGLGLGGIAEGRLRLHENFALTAGTLVKYNLAPYAGDWTFLAAPYIGFGF
jgi:hypothetical protein